TNGRTLLSRRCGGWHLARHAGLDQSLVPGARAGSRLQLLDGQPGNLLDHHAAVVWLDCRQSRLARAVLHRGRIAFPDRPAALAVVNQGWAARGVMVLAG